MIIAKYTGVMIVEDTIMNAILETIVILGGNFAILFEVLARFPHLILFCAPPPFLDGTTGKTKTIMAPL